MRKPRIRMNTTEDYERLAKFFMDNDLEFSENEPVPTDLVKSWELIHGDDNLVGGAVLAKRQGEYIIDGIAVEKLYRKFNLGTILLDKIIDQVKKLGGTKIFLVARAPEFFRKKGFKTVDKDNAPNFFECLTCPQYNVNCHPEIMMLEVK